MSGDKNKKNKKRFLQDYLSIDTGSRKQKNHLVLVEHDKNGNIININIIEMPEPELKLSRYHSYLN